MLLPRSSGGGGSATLTAGAGIEVVETSPDVWEVSLDSGAVTPTDAEFVTYAAVAELSAERILTAGANVTLDTTTPGQIIVNATGGGGGGTTYFPGGW